MIPWLVAFVFTQVVEVPIYLRALDAEGRKLSTPLAILIGFGASALTHPIVWFVFPRVVPLSYWGMVGCAEAFAVGAEALYFRAFGVKRALLWSLAANGASAGLGLLCRHFFGWP